MDRDNQTEACRQTQTEKKREGGEKGERKRQKRDEEETSRQKLREKETEEQRLRQTQRVSGYLARVIFCSVNFNMKGFSHV